VINFLANKTGGERKKVLGCSNVPVLEPLSLVLIKENGEERGSSRELAATPHPLAAAGLAGNGR
jgi:hypothetical protein